MIEKLEALARGDINRLALFLPPGSAKSTYASVLFPPWYLSGHPQSNILAASHTTELAEKWGRRVRNLIADNASELAVSISGDNQAAGRWALSSGAEYYAAGVGTGIAGFRAKLGIIDDPVRSRQDADSELIRDRIWDWYINDFTTRLVPGAAQLLIQTRWHEDDLAGRALQHDDWEVVSLPAIAEAGDMLGREIGEPLWSDGDYGYGAQLLELRGKTPARTWSALYQQRPAPEEGDYFRSEWLRTCSHLPDRRTLTIYGASDYAVTAGGGDYTVHVVVGLDPEGRMYLLDLWRGQADSARWVEALCDMIVQWKPLAWAEEQGQIRAGIGPFLEMRMRSRSAYVHREQFPTRGDKAVRAQSIRGRMSLNGLYVDARAPFLEALRSEMLSFPAGKHDDQVDALGLVGQLLDRMVFGQNPEPALPTKAPGYSSETRTETQSIMVL
ncbi:phage terminase large subunit [Xanthobacter sp. VNH20]|uniref:phage terminase large subunit n=1 Tax=Xanthobacter sp. VNH20 TaxID=3156616 RepID=UPI0032B5D518